MRWFGEADFDDRIARNRGGPRGRECREFSELSGRKRDDFHILTEQDHCIHRHGNEPGSEAEETAEIKHDHDLAAAVADDLTDVPQDVLALDRTENVSANEIAHPNRLRESHGS